MITSRPRGVNDVTPEEIHKWHHVEEAAREVCRLFGYREIRTPIFEHSELFKRGVGDTTDIVQKEMYTFEDRGGRSLTLRPEGTAPVVRAYLENKLYALPQPAKLYYFAPGFRYERPQKGRLRQFTQFGVEAFGSSDPALDAEIIGLAVTFLGRFGLRGLSVRLNSIGCSACRPAYREALLEHFRPRLDELCDDCRGRYHRNPLRLLDCKNESCRRAAQGAPGIGDHLCPECSHHFEEVKAYLDILGLSYEVDPFLVRGLDYYTNTVFEITYSGLGAQNQVCAGGRYDGLVEEIGGPPTPGIGFGLGLERLIITLDQEGYPFPEPARASVFVAVADEKSRKAGFVLLSRLHEAGISAEFDYMGRSLKGQLKYANKSGALFSVIVGSDELSRGVVTLRKMAEGEQEEVPVEGLVPTLEKYLWLAGE